MAIAWTARKADTSLALGSGQIICSLHTRLDALTPAAVTCSILALRGRTVDDNPHAPVPRARPLDFRVCGRCRRRHPAPAARDEGLAAARRSEERRVGKECRSR